jgi:hypothetical protein
MPARTRGGCPDDELITAFVDGALESHERDDVPQHVAGCADCRALADAERRTKSALAGLRDEDVVPSSDLLARLASIPASNATHVPVARGAAVSGGAHRAPSELDERRRRRAPAYLGAAASVVVFMVGAFAFLGASAPTGDPSRPSGVTAVVPAADRLQQEHAATSAGAGLAGPGFSAVSTAFTPAPAPVVSR